MRLIVAMLFPTLGLAFPSLLNGQTFTNSLVGIACPSAAVAPGAGLARDPRARAARLRAGRIVVGLAVLLAAALLAQLPSAYRFQAGFNRRLEQLRQGGYRAGSPGKASMPRSSEGAAGS
jgi:hypothetical protein